MATKAFTGQDRPESRKRDGAAEHGNYQVEGEVGHLQLYIADGAEAADAGQVVRIGDSCPVLVQIGKGQVGRIQVGD
ncbi:hypothetical protein D3C80_2124160 [compost metagenome]